MSKEVMKLALSTLEGWANYDDWVWPEGGRASNPSKG